MRYIVASALLIISIASKGDSLVQTDWSGGSGVIGPVLDLGNEFYCDTETNWTEEPGALISEFDPLLWNVATSVEPTDCCTMDLDGDGDLDVGASLWWSNRFMVYENLNGLGTSWGSVNLSSTLNYPQAVCSGDFNGDGYDDLIGAAKDDEVTVIFINPGLSGGDWSMVYIDNVYFATSLSAADINQDGNMDVVGANLLQSTGLWWENVDGSGTVWNRHLVGQGWDFYNLSPGDIDGDGDIDLTGAASEQQVIAWWENTDGFGEVWAYHPIETLYQYATIAVPGDIDSDGDMDVVGTSRVHGTFDLWKNLDGTGLSWEKSSIGNNFSADLVSIVDIDQDGDADVTGVGRSVGRIILFLNKDASGTQWVKHPFGDFAWPGVLEVCDINGDNVLDLLSCSSSENKIAWWSSVFESYSDLGLLESSIYQMQPMQRDSFTWGTISWNSLEPEGTAVRFLVRSSNSSTEIHQEEWSDTISVSGTSLNGLLSEDCQYIQYKAILSSSEISLTPELYDVTITWDGFTSIQQQSAHILAVSLGVECNPSSSIAQINFAGLSETPCELSVFDLSGRLSFRNMVEGDGVVVIPDLPTGIYTCVLQYGSDSLIQRFTVVSGN